MSCFLTPSGVVAVIVVLVVVVVVSMLHNGGYGKTHPFDAWNNTFPLPRLADPVLTTHTLLWGSIGEPFVKKWVGDKEYLWAYTKGFSELPSPAQVHKKRT